MPEYLWQDIQDLPAQEVWFVQAFTSVRKARELDNENCPEEDKEKVQEYTLAYKCPKTLGNKGLSGIYVIYGYCRCNTFSTYKKKREKK